MKRLVLVGLLLPLAACSETPNLGGLTGPEYKGDQLANDVVTAINRQADQMNINSKAYRAESAECEDVESMEKGAISDCTVTMENGKEVFKRVTMQDDEGHFLVE